MMWSDSVNTNGYMNNPRGAGFLFGQDEVDRFCYDNTIRNIVRSHQLVMSGYQEMFSGKLFTVWSALNYCYSSG
jgi:diadenosine tetraphosphatase ApaH/serine/threonine PP2A family protein phosphatase